MGGKRIRGLKVRVGCKCCISRRKVTLARLSSGGIPAGGVRGERHSAGRCGISKTTGRSREGSSKSEICQEF